VLYQMGTKVRELCLSGAGKCHVAASTQRDRPRHHAASVTGYGKLRVTAAMFPYSKGSLSCYTSWQRLQVTICNLVTSKHVIGVWGSAHTLLDQRRDAQVMPDAHGLAVALDWLLVLVALASHRLREPFFVYPSRLLGLL